jgi:hypothetical protein
MMYDVFVYAMTISVVIAERDLKRAAQAHRVRNAKLAHRQLTEFWEDHFKCRYPNSSRTPYNKKYTKTCTTKERLTKQDTAFEDQLQFVSDAVMAFAYAFR